LTSLDMNAILQTDTAHHIRRPVRLTLTSRALIHQGLAERNLVIEESPLSSILGASCVEGTEVTGGPVLFKLTVFRYLYPRKSNLLTTCCMKPSKHRAASHLEYVMQDKYECDTWVSAINTLVTKPYFPKFDTKTNAKRLPRRKFLIILNPKAGQGKSPAIFQDVVKEMLIQANIDHQLFVTEGANHAYLYILSFDWTSYDAVVTIGGDGTLAEVVNGLCNRDDGEAALAKIVLIPLGGGTGNGLIKSILFQCDEEYSLTNALFCGIRGSPQWLDLAYVQTPNRGYHSFLLLGWGLIADIDILSEGMRWMGELRLYAAAVYFILNKRMYRGRLSLLLTSAVAEAPVRLPPLGSPLSSEWDVIEGDFSFLTLLQTSHCSISMHSGPGARLDDGIFTVQYVRSASHWQLLEILLAFDNGDHIHHPMVKSQKAYAYRLEPLTSEGRFTLDGELVEYGPIQGIVMRRGATVFTLDSSVHTEV
jgi:sphingosine kinase